MNRRSDGMGWDAIATLHCTAMHNDIKVCGAKDMQCFLYSNKEHYSSADVTNERPKTNAGKF